MYLDALIYGVRDILFPGTTALARKSRLRVGDGLTATVDQANDCIRLDATAATLFTPVAVTEDTALPDGYRSLLVTVDPTADAISLATPEDATDGYAIDLRVGRATASPDNTVELTDPNGYKFQDPDHADGALLDSLTFDAARNLYLVLVTDAGDTYWSI